MTIKNVPDTLSYQAATRLKNKIENVWFKAGLRGAKARLVCVESTKDERPIYVIRSNVTFDERGHWIVQPSRLT